MSEHFLCGGDDFPDFRRANVAAAQLDCGLDAGKRVGLDA